MNIFDIERIRNNYMHQTIYITGHKYPDIDSYISSYLMHNLFNYFNIKSQPIILIPYDEIDIVTKNIIEEYGLPKYDIIVPDIESSYFLLDHNDTTESIQFIPKNIVGIIDHHRKFTNEGILNFIVDAGSTTTLLYQIYKELDLDISNKIKKLILLGLLYDTCGLTSSKAQDKDKALAYELSNELGLNLRKECLKSIRYTDLSMDAEKLLKNGFKVANYNGKQIASSYLEVRDINDISMDLMNELELRIKIYNYEYYLLNIYCFNNNKTITNIYNDKHQSKKILDYNFIASRATTILPDVYKMIDNEFQL